MKKITAIFFLLFLSISQIGHSIIFYVQLWHIKTIVKEAVSAGVQESFCDIIEDNENIRWEEAGEEFSLNGEWYDVVTSKKSGGKTLLYCLNDKKEERLLQTFTNTIALTSGHEKGKSDQYAFKFHITDQYIISATQTLPPAHFTKTYHTCVKAALSSSFPEIYIPPPRKGIS